MARDLATLRPEGVVETATLQEGGRGVDASSMSGLVLGVP